MSASETYAEQVDVGVGDTVAVTVPFRNGTGSIERRSVTGRVTETVGGAMDPLWLTVLVSDGVEGEDIVLMVNAVRGRVRVVEEGES